MIRKQEKLNQKNTHDEEVESTDTQHERSSLIISNIQPNDAGEYICRIMIRSTDEINVNHTIIVRKAGVAVVTVRSFWNFHSLTQNLITWLS